CIRTCRADMTIAAARQAKTTNQPGRQPTRITLSPTITTTARTTTPQAIRPVSNPIREPTQSAAAAGTKRRSTGGGDSSSVQVRPLLALIRGMAFGSVAAGASSTSRHRHQRRQLRIAGRPDTADLLELLNG